MAMGASCEIVNNTGHVIVFTTISQVNDDSTWNIKPPVATKIANGDNCLISMGNSSFFPRGVGFDAQFVDSNLNPGRIYLDDPAVGKHEFTFNGNFKFTQTNPSGNSYVITINPA
ncbi:MAG: hypothetical protein ABJH98_13205 [Reichenbachiella sp.]|uniref:hypothetical protein n=1 Tax=Reichenbachiella sp. TaxID=2184521 RepID=UPI003299E12F